MIRTIVKLSKRNNIFVSKLLRDCDVVTLRDVLGSTTSEKLLLLVF